jgi:protein SCO1
MPMFIRRHLVLFTVVVVAVFSPVGHAHAQSLGAPNFTADEVGLDEKLGETIPLDMVLRDESGKPVVLRTLIDKPTILTLNYFRCAGLCSVQLNAVARVLNLTRADPGKDFQVLTVSFDDRDTFEIAAQKRLNYLGQLTRPFPATAWRFFTGEAKSTKALSDAVGFKFKRVGEDFVHPATLIFLSPQGKVTRYMFGTTYLPADLQMAVQEAARGEARPTVNKWLRFCYSYDPQGRTYVLNITRLTALIILGAATGFGVFVTWRGRRAKLEAKDRA